MPPGTAIREPRIRTKRYGKRRSPGTERAVSNWYDSLQETSPNLTRPHPILINSYDPRRNVARMAPAVSRRAILRKSANRTPILPNIIRNTIRQKWYLNARRHKASLYVLARGPPARSQKIRYTRTIHDNHDNPHTRIHDKRRHAERLSAYNS